MIFIRGLSGKFADTVNKTHNVYPTLKKFCINEYQVSNTHYTQYDSLLLIIDWFIGHEIEQGCGARSMSQINVHVVKSMHL